MPAQNNDISRALDEAADLLDFQGENPFRIRAYRNAARLVAGLGRSVADMVRGGEELSELPGIGQDLAGKLREFCETGTFALLEDLRRRLPPGVHEMMGVAGLGAKRTKLIHDELGVRSVAELRAAAEAGRLRLVPGMGPKLEHNVLDAIRAMTRQPRGFRLETAEQYARSLLDYLRQDRSVRRVEAAGSFRRRKDVVGDLDLLVLCDDGAPVMDRFTRYEDVARVAAKGGTRSTVVLRSGLQVDLRAVPPESYGAALFYFTGSKAHNIAVRKLGLKKGLKINEYGAFRARGRGKAAARAAGRTEEEMYAAVGLPYIEPELREDRGELEAALEGRLPRLVTLGDIRGDLHSHTDLTDGRDSLEAMAEAARARGYEYLADTEHSRRLTVAKGLGPAELRRQLERIDRLNGRLKGLVVLKSIELDILEDGRLDLPDDVLRELDLTVCSVHHKFDLTRRKQTERILRAMDNPYFNVLAHPTGRLIGSRPPYDVDMDRIIGAAKERGCVLELDARPDRLDIDDVYCKAAKEAGVKVSIASDAHSAGDLDLMRFGVDQARRGWLEPADVVNTRSLSELRALLRRR